MTDEDEDLGNLQYAATHIFFPPKLPQKSDLDMKKEHGICVLVHQIAQMYANYLPLSERKKWEGMTNMLENLAQSQELEELDEGFISSKMAEMCSGDVLTFPIRAQNAGLVLRKLNNRTVFESFELSAPNATIMARKGKLLCSYPGPAISIPSEIFENSAFQKEFASFITQMNRDILDSAAMTTKANSTVVEERDVASPRYITELLTGILRGMGQVEKVTRIRKRIGDDVLWKDARIPWRRSPVWLLIRVVIQTSLFHEAGRNRDYKSFMIYIMARILRMCLKNEFSSELLYCFRAKVSRRLYKLRSLVPPFVLQKLSEVSSEIEQVLRNRWLLIQKQQSESPVWAPRDLDFVADTCLSLTNSRAYLCSILQNNGSSASSSAFSPAHPDRYFAFHQFCDAGLPTVPPNEIAIMLADFEMAVQHDIDDWVAANLGQASSSTKIASCIKQYSSLALTIYDGNPENQSTMLLTVFELWVALDRIVVKRIPLLADYSPEVPLHILQKLLLRRRESLHRLARIQVYLRRRHEGSSQQPIFTDEATPSSFPVRAFRSSPSLQQLKIRIENDATAARQQKYDELAQKNETYHNLLAESDNLGHQYQLKESGKNAHKKKKCRKCSLKSMATKMKIDPYEWPLPSEPLVAQLVVFELRCPKPFAHWRSMTYYILHDICMTTHQNPAEVRIRLDEYPALQKYCAEGHGHGIVLASSTKSFHQTHYKSAALPSTESRVCVQNGLTFRLLDSSRQAWAAITFEDCSVAPRCVLEISSSSPYRVLQSTVETPFYSSNQAVADQSECPKELNLHEFIAFATLRSGPELQWLNIARELRAKALSFHTIEVHTLIVHTAWQVGPLSPTGDWMWHAPLRLASFSLILLEELEDLMTTVEANWLEAISVRTITVLAGRLLASASDQHVVGRALRLMRKARDTTYRWTIQLAQNLQSSEDESQIRDLQLRVIETAATCRGAYDVDSYHFTELLSSAEDLSILIECGFLIQDNTPASDTAGLDHHLVMLLDRDRRFAHIIEPLLHRRVQQTPEGLHRAVHKVWNSYRPGSHWQTLPNANERWLVTFTGAEANFGSQEVHVNLLGGQLLVEGRPLGRLPRNILNHPIYRRVLGAKVLDVTPADMVGMDFATRSPIAEFQVYFALIERTNHLIIRTKRGPEILELLSHEKLSGDLPSPFVNEFAHWMDISSGEIEFRPIINPWVPTVDNWRMAFSLSKDTTMRHPCSGFLIDPRSPTFYMVSGQLKALEYEEFQTITYSRVDQSLSANLPRLRLSFFLDIHHLLACHNFPGTVVDVDQSIGTMYGLQSRLVLRPARTGTYDLPSPRRVIVPEGMVRFSVHEGHVNARVDTKSTRTVRYHDYIVDTEIGRLSGVATLKGRLYKVYMHAITSHCLPDPLTARTGTEEALHELRSAGSRSFQNLTPDEADLLLQIAHLSPKREFYPIHRRSMQTIRWLDLPTLAQHPHFQTSANEILDYARRLGVFGNQPELEISWTCLPQEHRHLLERADYRSMHLYPAELADSSALGSEPDDGLRIDAATHEGSQNEARAYDISKMIHDWPSKLPTTRDIFHILTTRMSLLGFDAHISISYSSDWLDRNIPEVWVPLYNVCRRSTRADCFQLAFSFGSLAYGSIDALGLLPSFLAFATTSEFEAIEPPHGRSYNLQKGFIPMAGELKKVVLSFAIKFQDSPESRLSVTATQSSNTRDHLFESRLSSQADELVKDLIDQWPSPKPKIPTGKYAYFRTATLEPSISALFRVWYGNKKLHDHILLVQRTLDKCYTDNKQESRFYGSASSFDPDAHSNAANVSFVTFEELLRRHPPSIPDLQFLSMTADKNATIASPGLNELQLLLQELQIESNLVGPFHRQYGADLANSQRYLVSRPPLVPQGRYTLLQLLTYGNQCGHHFREISLSLRKSLSPCTPAEAAIFTAGLWPRITTKSLLHRLTLVARRDLTADWGRVILKLSRAISLLQHSRRLLRWALAENYEELNKELQSTRDSFFDDEEYPDWSLIQVEGNFLIRPTQCLVAKEMITPESGSNIVLQLNMGEGKSSVIVPLVATALADGCRLSRVVILKQLSSQMFHLLVERVSGLTNRRVFYMPFSRNVTLGASDIQQILTLYKECIETGGILLVQPEHILSLKLRVVDKLLCSASPADHKIAEHLSQMQLWLEARSRDILDESDEILHSRYQLIYTVGQQRLIEDSPDRWQIIQEIFSLVKIRAPQIFRQHPLGLSVTSGDDAGFPSIRIIQDGAGRALVCAVAQDALNGGLTSFSFALSPNEVKGAALRIVLDVELLNEDINCLRQYCGNSVSWLGLLVLRGMMACGILHYTLKERRWRVDYGLDLARSLMAVPYRAKDVPSLRAEFGHPDIAISLTCLSYYYAGLTVDQLATSFGLIQKLDNPVLEYEKWLRRCEHVPETMRHIAGVNIRDLEQWNTNIVPLFRRNHAVVDFYLSNVVFPREVKEFPHKLSTSGWDMAEIKDLLHLTTGFSGTNDNRYLLPTSIAQFDIDALRGTNAEVLSHLLQAENQHYRILPPAKDFIGILVQEEPEIQVLLDVGAQMLELQNAELALLWLSLKPQAIAVIFFGHKDDLQVMTRDGVVDSLVSSPFSQQLDKCLVYLDDAHTRGTDLKLPLHARAAVTLGPKTTKDRLVQGCMRMRKLGRGQSLIFFAPDEVDRDIRRAAQKRSDDIISTLDIVRWAILETCSEIQHFAPHWAQQGLDHERRKSAWDLVTSKVGGGNSLTLKSSWMQPEGRTLEELYMPQASTVTGPHPIHSAPVSGEILSTLDKLAVPHVVESSMGEEHEREVNHEVERERQVERPPKATAFMPSVHEHVKAFVRTGAIPNNSPAFISPFGGFNEWSSELLVTMDFYKTTISGLLSLTPNDYMRPVNWIISSTSQGETILVLISPHEANTLLPEIIQGSAVHLHQYAPRVTEAMKSFEDLLFYCTPSLPPAWKAPSKLLVMQVNLWAGQLYLPDYETYVSLCNYLGLYTKELEMEGDLIIQHDGFVRPEDRRGTMLKGCPFMESPLPFLKKLYGFRRKGMSFMSTHMGKLLHGRTLSEEDFS